MKFAYLCFDMLYRKDSPELKELYELVNEILQHLFDEYNKVLTIVGNVKSS